ncbi:MAG: leucine--tRNA ligase [Nanoarchaeota archaeon]|nr:leucine--tRNA ligase [Nanoarchaeota archaeon]
MLDFKKIQDKWQKRWKKDNVFRVDVKDYKKPKYYITTPYPYMSGLLHIGHIFTYIYPEVMSRFKRMQGNNVLFKWGFHCTGTPLVAAAKRVAEGEEKQIEILKQMGIPDKDISKFEKPEHWANHFSKETLKDVKAMGFSIDERYTFITTSLNPPYDSFIRWQFNKLKDKGYVKKGKHPVVWCPKDNAPVGDHARAEGEGETPQQFCLFKFKLDDDRFVVTATLRPDTAWGITNVYANPEIEYVEIDVKGQKWIVGEPIIEKLNNQDYHVKVIGKVSGKDLVGKKVESFGGTKILILPATFLDPEYGTGLVHSVPSDSADDLIALQDLQKDDDTINKFGLNIDEVKAIKPIEIFDTPEIGGNPAQYFLDKYKVNSQNQRDILDKIKKELYKLTFNQAKFNSKYKKGFSKDLSGTIVKDGQDIIKKDLLKQGIIELFYELTGEVVCRCLTKCVVKIVSDQWFIEYNDPKWKKITHKCLDGMTIYPDIVRKQFEYVLDWLHRWACARELGLGTKLPWDENWVIESLSDSTLQMVYCTISKYLQHPKDYGFKVDKLNDDFFDYVFMSKGKIADIESSTGIPKDMIEKMKGDFEYWYPFDFRNSAKDLLQNHLSFCLFIHTALFDKKYWPKAYSLNGRVMVDNQKMSKSKGNFYTTRELYEKNSSDVVRLAAANAGEGVDDANYDMSFMDTAAKKLNDVYTFAAQNYNKGRSDRKPVDDWFESIINGAVLKTTELMENVQFKSALYVGFFELQRKLKWYTRRTNGDYNKNLINKFIDVQIKILSPFTPHICEDIWELIKGKGYIANAEWPKCDKAKINIESQKGEELITQVMVDMQAVLKLANLKQPKKITLIVAHKWKYKFMDTLRKVLADTRDFKQILGKVLSGDLKQYGKHITKLIPKYVKAGSVPESMTQKFESDILNASKDFFSKEYYDSEIVIEIADRSEHVKAKQSMPGKPAILIE